MKINWPGLVGSIATFALIIFSFFYPWWELKIGNIGQADISPINLKIDLFGLQFRIPAIYFINLACLLSLIASAIAMLIYSLLPDKNYSKDLLKFAYKKPLIVLIIFSLFLLIILYPIRLMFSIYIPINGSTNVTLPAGDAEIEAIIKTGFTFLFWLAIISALLCIIAKFYHRKFKE
ncbi:MAG: hypothetical protein H5T45_02250 [Thermoplasmatales archaeon]|nr:hypothetical protein [Thermoplasmatales archaeon]